MRVCFVVNTPPPYGYQPPGHFSPRRAKLYGLPLIIPGAVVAAIGFIVLVTGGQQYGLCNSTYGQIGQQESAQAATNCQQIDIGHNVCEVLIAAGVVLAVWGVIRMFWKRQAQLR